MIMGQVFISWRRFIGSSVALGLLAATLLPSHVYAQNDPAQTILVQIKPGASEAERAAVVAAMGGVLVTWMPQINVAEVRFSADAAVAAGAAAADQITFAETDGVVTGTDVIDDPSLTNSDQGYGWKKVDAVNSWHISTGITQVVVAVVDTGLNMQHPEFAGRVAAGYDFVNEDNDPTDDHGHGTHVAGIIAAAADHTGTVGICPHCTIMPVKVLNANNSGTWSSVAKGILFAVDNGAKVINLSLGAAASSKTVESAVQYAQDHNVVVVAASGNAGSTTPFYPAAINYVVAVGATQKDDTLWPLSNTGDYIDVTAPGVAVYSTYFDLNHNGGFAYMTGTSMAAPFVSGLAGLLFSQKPDRTAQEVIDLITANTDDLGAAGNDPQFGSGRINAYKTMLAANGGVDPVLQGDPTPNDPTNPTDPITARSVFLPVTLR